MVHCRQKDDAVSDGELVDPESVLNYEENDTLVLRNQPGVLKEWLNYYHQVDTGFRLGRFRASGVSLHIGELPEAISKGNETEFTDLFVYSPDSLHYLDLFSYSYLREQDTLYPGEPDQQVVLGNKLSGSKKQLMYFGPSQLAEFATWTGRDNFIIGLTYRTESGRGLDAEIMFFHLKDSVYTNFRLDHTISLDSLMMSKQSFADHFFKQRQFNVK